MRSPGINGEGELRGQPANPGSPGKMAVKTECVFLRTSEHSFCCAPLLLTYLLIDWCHWWTRLLIYICHHRHAIVAKICILSQELISLSLFRQPLSSWTWV